MKRFLLLVLIVLSTLGADTKVDKYYKELYNLSNEQRYKLYFSYAMGYKHDLGLTLAAIAWKESHFGKYPMNLADGKHGSFSMYHIVLDYAALRRNKTSMWDKSRLAETLLKDDVFAAEEAIAVLKYFGSKKNCNWKCSVASYNAGHLGLKSKKGAAYAEDIALRTKAIDKYFTKHQVYYKIKTIVFNGK